MEAFEFMLIVRGFGDDPDEAFGDALRRLLRDPHEAIEEEVTYEKREVRLEEMPLIRRLPQGEA